MGRKLNDGFISPRKKRIVILEDIDFVWDQCELNKIVQMWETDVPIIKMGERFDRYPDEVLMAIVHLARKDKLEFRNIGAGIIN
jgi:hypothetical protein